MFERSACPDVEQLDAWSSGSLPAESSDAIVAHLGRCPSCRASAAEVEANLAFARTLAGRRVRADLERIGPYRLLREVGRGGMGVVFEALQDNPRRRVAVKLIDSLSIGADPARIVRREARALARLSHPGIAAVLEAGRHDDGRWFVAMEFVEGTPWNAWVGARQPRIDELLELFEALCDAVAYAHRKGVIHRDLKPQNVLVAQDGRVKVLDFGLARILEADEDVATSPSLGTGSVQGTVPYMSPEQVRGDNRAVDVRSDVYSLGVMLYESLVGRLPYDLPRDNLVAAAHWIATKPPVRPSSLRRELAGDLETIVLQALAKDPRERYASADALADDLRRFRARQPIAARTPTAVYQLTRLVQRHPLASAGALLLLLGASIAAVVMSVLYRRAGEEQVRAKLEAERYQAAMEIWDEAIGSAHPHQTKGPGYTVLELVDSLSGSIAEQALARPEVEATLRLTLAKAYRGLGRPGHAREHLERAIEQLERAGEGAMPAADEGRLELAWALHDLGRYDQAREHFERIEAAWRARPGDIRLEVAEARCALGDLARHAGDHLRAEELAREALALAEDLGERGSPLLLEALSNLSQALLSAGRLAEAEEVAGEALEAALELRGEDHPTVASFLNTLGYLRKARKDFAGAEELYARALAIRRRLHAGDHPALAQVLNNYGELERARRHDEEAARLHREALAMRRRLYPEEDHEGLCESLNNMALAEWRLGDHDAAEAGLTAALRMVHRMRGPDHASVRMAVGNLASLYRVRGRIEEADKLLADPEGGIAGLE